MDPRFTVDARGQVIAEDAGAQRELATRSGRFSLAPTGSDLLCFIKNPPTGGERAPPRAVLIGDAGTFPVSDLIAFLSQLRWSGLVRVPPASGQRSIYVKEGEVRGAMSDDPADRLGEVVIRLGYLTRKQLEQALDQAPSSKMGRVLVDRGLLEAHQLWKCITQQLSDIFHAMVLCREGAFLLIDQEMDEKSMHSVQLSTQSLLMDSIRKIDEMAHFRKRIPHGRVHVARKRASDGKLEEEEDRVLALVDGERTVLELGQAAKMSEFDVTKIIFRLMEGGYVGVSERPHARVSPAALGVAASPVAASAKQPSSSQAPFAVIRIFNFIFREIRDEVAKRKMETEFIAAANAALARRALSA